MPSPVNKRLNNVVIWGLEDMEALCQDLDGEGAALLAHARERMDLVAVCHAANIRSAVGALRLLASDARRGEYRGPGREVGE
jgi:hypothetical protein